MNSQGPFYLNPKAFSYQVHPITVFEILDHHRRRREQKRVFGLLVGHRRRRKVEITGALNILVQINEEEKTIQDIKLVKEVIELHKQTCPKDQIVGIYATADCANTPDFFLARVHEHLSKRMPAIYGESSLCLVVGTGAHEDSLKVQGFTSKKFLGVCRYVGVPIKINGSDVENLGVWTLMNTPEHILDKEGERGPLDTTQIHWKSDAVVAHDLNSMVGALNNFQRYVTDESRRREDIGWELASILSEVPCIPEEDFESRMSGSIQDILMNVNLAKLQKVHLNLANKLNLSEPKQYI